MEQSGFIRVKVDYQDTLRQMEGIKKEQFPYAFALALTRVAQEGQKAARDQAHRAFDLHTEYLPRNILIVPAKKKELVQFGSTQSEVFTGENATKYLAIHETGGTKKPVEGRSNISIPSTDFPDQGFTRSGAVKANLKPKKLLEYYNATKNAKGRKKSKRKAAFVLPAQGTRPAAIVRRSGGARQQLDFLYVFKPSVEIKPEFGMEKAVRIEVDRTFEYHMEHELNKAIEWANK